MPTKSIPAKPDLRRHQRILIPAGRAIRVAGAPLAGRPGLEGVVTVIGLGGMFFRSVQSHPAGTVLRLQLADTVFPFEFECTVRNVAPNGLGVEFTGITRENEQKLKALLSAIKL
jgi:hypothetical protein